ncbi:MAG TPA: TadE/TadG family type IV pilus assembly protein [Lysobacter sp.]|nr:TadE/TadG family type IV pilus assembly protein [Lysobacter sp.]
MHRPLQRLRRFLRATDGAAAVEFALVVPVFILFCIGIFEAGRMMWIRNSIQTATEEAARYAMVHTTATDPELAAHASNYYDDVSLDAPTFTAGTGAVLQGGAIVNGDSELDDPRQQQRSER